jgi:glutamate synthase (NADPH/NADH) small chain
MVHIERSRADPAAAHAAEHAAARKAGGGRSGREAAVAQTMQRFISVGRAMPRKRLPAERRRDFREIYETFEPEPAAEQASRCEQCGIPYCQIHCPLENNIPDWLKLAAEGRLEEAYRASQATNTFPEICGRICPHDRLCEGSCVLEQSRHGTVTIGAVERYVTDTAWDKGWVEPPRPTRELPTSVGIVGAGPGGLAAADMLRRRGHQVVVYDRYDRVGGLLVYGIPNFKLEKRLVERRARLLADGGVRFRLGCDVGPDGGFAELKSRHDALLIATGVYKYRDAPMPGAGLKNIFQAMDYLTASNKKGLGDRVPEFDSGALDARGKNVIVIGGGDTAMDCVRTAVRQGAKSVKCVYRRDRQNMPGSRNEVRHAEEEGVEFVWLTQPEAYLGNGVVAGVRCQRVHLGVADSSGRQTPQPIPGSAHVAAADMVIKALGFDAEDLPALFGESDLAVARDGTIVVDGKTKMTNVPGVFAAGDIIRGASLVVWAIKDGREAAEGIHRYVQAKAGARALDGLKNAS